MLCLDNLGAFVVKIGTSVREENANLTEWVNFHEHGFSQCITPLVYGETTIEHESASGRGGRVTVLVESAVVLAEVGLEEFLYDLVRADSMGWDRAVYALGEIISCIGINAWLGQKDHQWSWSDRGLWNGFFCEKGYCLVDFERVEESPVKCKYFRQMFGRIVRQCCWVLRCGSMPERIKSGLERFVSEGSVLNFNWREQDPIPFFKGLRSKLHDLCELSPSARGSTVVAAGLFAPQGFLSTIRVREDAFEFERFLQELLVQPCTYRNSGGPARNLSAFDLVSVLGFVLFDFGVAVRQRALWASRCELSRLPAEVLDSIAVYLR